MGEIKNMIALDCGNSSFRIVLGRYDGKTVATELVEQIPNDMVRVGEYYYWDFLKIFDGFKGTLKKALTMAEKIDSIGICTWGVDFGLFDKDGNLASNALSYRNTIGSKHLERLSEEQKRNLFFETGILCDKINSVYMLSGIKEQMPAIYSIADKLLMVPDVFNYLLTGIMLNEPSELSTTQLMSSKTMTISKKVCEQFGIPEGLFSKIGKHGEKIGNLTDGIKDELGIAYDIPVICVPSHDTASAVAAIPAKEKDFAFISSGTWSLIGTELDEPVISDAVMSAGLTNEVGALSKITLLKNSAGMFIIQRIKKEFDIAHSRKSTWDELDMLADGYEAAAPVFNVNNPRFFNPDSMSTEIWDYLLETKQVSGTLDWAAVIKATHESMACCYAVTIQKLEEVSNKKFDTIYIAGGGSKNIAVNELTAERTGKKIVACSKESTSLGNIAIQLKYFEPEWTLDNIRDILAASIETKVYSRQKTHTENISKYMLLP